MPEEARPLNLGAPDAFHLGTWESADLGLGNLKSFISHRLLSDGLWQGCPEGLALWRISGPRFPEPRPLDQLIAILRFRTGVPHT